MIEFKALMDALGGFLWGWPMLTLLVGTGVLYTVLLKGVQFRLLGYALNLAFHPNHNNKHKKNDHDGDISHFQALMTALCATVGTGNIAGVATAIALGGPGALFWMWVTGILGMATKFAEGVLGVHFRLKRRDGTLAGGPMYYLRDGVRWPILGALFAVFLILGGIGAGGMVQSNSIGDVLWQTFALPKEVTAILIIVPLALVWFGGVQRIGQFAGAVAPTMILIYVVTGSVVLLANITHIPSILAMVFTDAFTGTAAAGGFAGAVLKDVLRQGFSRGVFSNESGLGSSPIAAAAAKTKHPVEQALVSMTQTMIDTLVVCTFTALVIISSGLWQTAVADNNIGAGLTAAAFSQTLSLSIWDIPLGNLIVSFCLIFFAFTSILGWGYYGEQALNYLSKGRGITLYKFAFVIAVALGTFASVPLVWNIAEISIGLMIIPNLIGLIILAPLVRRLLLDYQRSQKDGQGFAIKPFHN